MKKMFLSLAILCGLSTVANAQVEAGKMWVSGNVGVSTSKVKDGDRMTNYKIIPEFGYQLSNNCGIGIQLGYAHNEYADEEFGRKMKSDGFIVKPYARYSFLKGNLGGFFVDGGAGYAYSKIKSTDTKMHEFSVGFQPGVYINASDKISITGKFGFLGYQYDKIGDTKINSFGFDFDMKQVELGVSIAF